MSTVRPPRRLRYATGVKGEATGAGLEVIGVLGLVGDGRRPCGVWAATSVCSAAGTRGSAWPAFSSANVHVTGTLSKGAGAFRIDHPLEPETKYLQHSFVESPDMMNVYNGNVRTDRRGFATVRLPRYFRR